MLATFAQTIISMKATAPRSAKIASRSIPRTSGLLKGTTGALHPEFVLGYCTARRAATVSMTA